MGESQSGVLVIDPSYYASRAWTVNGGEPTLSMLYALFTGTGEGQASSSFSVRRVDLTRASAAGVDTVLEALLLRCPPSSRVYVRNDVMGTGRYLGELMARAGRLKGLEYLLVEETRAGALYVEALNTND